MAVDARVVSAATTATLLTSSPSDLVAGQSGKLSVPSGGVTVFVGPSDVTTSDGFPVAAGESLTFGPVRSCTGSWRRAPRT